MKIHRLDVVELVLFAIFAIGIMFAAAMATEDENPFPTSKPPPTGAMVPAKWARADGARKAHGTGVCAPSK